MSESALVSAFVHGIAVGLTLLVVIGIVRSGLRRDVKVVAVLFGVSVAAWIVQESQPLWIAVGTPWPVDFAACAVAGLFWLFVLVVFADVRLTPLMLLPAAVLLVAGQAMGASGPPLRDWLWWGRNIVSALLAIHAAVLILRGWPDDLLEGRRRFRGPVLALACLFAVVEVGAGFAFRLTHDPVWLSLVVGRVGGGLMLAAVTLALGALLLRPDPGVFGAARRSEPVADVRAEAAERLTLERLEALMADGGWRREGLTIGALAKDLDIPEHRLRRLINGRLGYRNFADFLNARRIEAAKARLANPAEARTTVAAIAFDLGYGSLGPFNRAFRSATGASPTEWRRGALASASPELKEAG